MRSLIFSIAFAFVLGLISFQAAARIATDSTGVRNSNMVTATDIKVEVPEVIIQDVAVDINISFINSRHNLLQDNNNELSFLVNGMPTRIQFVDGVGKYRHTFTDVPQLKLELDDFVFEKTTSPIPLWLSLIPPLIAILMALIFKEVITSLFIGIFIGGAIIGAYTEGPVGILTGLLSVIDKYVINSLNDWGHLAVIIFSMLIGGIVSLISRNGGMQGVVNVIARFAKDARSGQFATWLLGIAVFFDDYANTLVVGNTMRPVTDKLRISREKLSYIVDSTAAPIASIAFVTTWIGFELGYIETSLEAIGIEESAYSVFVSSLAYSFYPVFALLFILILIFQGKDFGPMANAEIRARTTGKVYNDVVRQKRSWLSLLRKSNPEVDDGKDDGQEEGAANDELSTLQPAPTAKFRWYNALFPILAVIVGTFIGLYWTGINAVELPANIGLGRKLSLVIGAADSYYALLWASLSGLLVAIALTMAQGILSLSATIEAVLNGFKTMFGAIMILVLAWSLALVTEEMHTADFITNSMLSGGLSPVFIPALTFIIASLIAFSTGSSWGSMAILYPLMLPAAWQVCKVSGMDEESTMYIFYNVVSCVLAGSVLGDHCSPISDTTILSSLASSCNHIDHVRTQMPYALTVGSVAIIFGTLPGALGASSWVTFPIGIFVLWLIVYFIGEKVEDPGEQVISQ
jgi:Na+/H+ antiporter NhaC